VKPYYLQYDSSLGGGEWCVVNERVVEYLVMTCCSGLERSVAGNCRTGGGGWGTFTL
jgi:hypothetical protein